MLVQESQHHFFPVFKVSFSVFVSVSLLLFSFSSTYYTSAGAASAAGAAAVTLNSYQSVLTRPTRAKAKNKHQLELPERGRDEG
jgi:hypothetical protein